MTVSVSTHVLDTAAGKPASGVRVELARERAVVASGETDANGRIAELARDLEPGRYELVKPIEQWRIPDTVHALIAARIDRLPEEPRALLHHAAVIGQEFRPGILAALAALDGEAFESALQVLEESGFVHARAPAGARQTTKVTSRKRAGAAPWLISATCIGLPLPQFGTPHTSQCSGPQMASQERQNSGVVPW